MLRWNKWSLRNKILAIFLIILLGLMGLIFFYFTYMHRNFYLQELRRTLEHEAKLILAGEEVNPAVQDVGDGDRRMEELGEMISTRITIIRKDGIVLADSSSEPEEMDNHAGRPEIAAVLEGEERGYSSRYSDTVKKEMYYLALPVMQEGAITGVIRLSRSLEDINQVIARDIKNYLVFIVVVLGVVSLLTWRFTTSLVNPLADMTAMARKIARGNYGERIETSDYGNEIGVMARMFNFMAEKLEENVREINEEKNRVQAILNSMVDGVIAVKADKEIIMVNPAARELLNLPGNVAGRDFLEVVRHYHLNKSLELILEEKRSAAEEININSPEKLILRCHFAPIIDEEERVKGGVIVFTDITELRRLERMRSDFVSNVSHELRSPLTSIIGYVDTLLEGEVEDRETRHHFLQVIKEEADRLSLLIRDLLNLSRLENEKLELKQGDLKETVEKTFRLLSEGAEEKSISLRAEIANDLPPVRIVPEQMEQVMINLVDNGIKYTPEGGEVVVRTAVEEDRVRVEVEDNGIGIPEEEQERIFERFYRVDKARSRALGGTGIGLAIVKHIIQGHGSEIEVESEPGEGTIFRFYLRQA
ncbi:MAG: two-component system histidine kinase PnpS [Halanaerobiales bacterium]